MTTIKTTVTTVNLTTGEEKTEAAELHLVPPTLMAELRGEDTKGMCPECGRKHRSDQPHDAKSLAYQYKWYGDHGSVRWPNWADAMAHCAPEVQKKWRTELERMKQDVSLRPTEADIGRKVLYFGNTHPGGEIEKGVISSFNETTVFVRYEGKANAQATSPADLGWAGEKKDEVAGQDDQKPGDGAIAPLES